VENKPVITLARTSRCWQDGYGSPRVSGWVVSVLCPWRSSAAYHIDFTIEQYTCHIARARGHRRPGGVAVRTRVIDEDLGVACADRIVTGDHIHHAVESCSRHTRTCCWHSRPATPGIGCGIIDLHRIERTTERHTVESTRHIDVSANSGSPALRVWHG